MSEIIDIFRRAEPFLHGETEAGAVYTALGGLLGRVMKGETYASLERTIASGMDLLTRLVRERQNTGAPVDGGDTEYGEDVTRFLAAAKGAANGTKEQRRRSTPTDLDTLRIFLSEAGGNLVRAQELILELERHPDQPGHLNELFRIFHTIKGECGFLKITTLGELAHHLENLLDFMRGNRTSVDSDLVDLLLDGIDLTKRVLNALGNDDEAAVDRLGVETYIGRLTASIHRMKANIGELLIEQGKLTEDDVNDILRKQKDSNFERKFGEIAVGEKYISPEELADTLKNQTPAGDRRRTGTGNDAIIKVKASQVNFLVDMVGELLIIEGQLDEKDHMVGQLKKVTREMQYAAMQLRTEKVRNLFINMKRAVRDTARKLGKRVAATIHGDDLEIDRDLVEKLEEPLLHLVRNAVGHGIESSAVRTAAGKPAEGNVLIEAERRGNSIVIAVEDDGGGLDKERIIAKAVERKLLSVEDARALSDAAAFDLIFNEGFSTSESVDFVSGRGVGMDIVKTVTTQARGRVELMTEKGSFTRTELIFPLSAAIIDGMIVRCAGGSYIIPVANIVESVRIDEKSMFSVKGETEVINLRGEIIPVVDLASFLVGNACDAAAGRGKVAVIVTGNGRKKTALVLDEIIAKKEVFIKSLGEKFRGLRGISSGTILSGGKIGFVLDIDRIIGSTDPALSGVADGNGLERTVH